jgi:hypothetical protein
MIGVFRFIRRRTDWFFGRWSGSWTGSARSERALRVDEGRLRHRKSKRQQGKQKSQANGDYRFTHSFLQMCEIASNALIMLVKQARKPNGKHRGGRQSSPTGIHLASSQADTVLPKNYICSGEKNQ